jgi:hypothetical protein
LPCHDLDFTAARAVKKLDRAARFGRLDRSAQRGMCHVEADPDAIIRMGESVRALLYAWDRGITGAGSNRRQLAARFQPEPSN